MALLLQDQFIDDSLVVASPYSRLPRLDLGIDWGSRWGEFCTSLRDALTGPKPDGHEAVSGGADLRVEWIEGRRSGSTLIVAALFHVAAIWSLTLPIWGFLPKTENTLRPVQIEMSWYVPEDLHPISLAAQTPKKSHAESRAAANASDDQTQRGADAFHPRQTILSVPVKMTHPRQTLIQPNALMQAPKVVEQLPNVVEWSAPHIERPTIQYSTSASTPQMRQMQRRSVAAPQIADPAKNATVNIEHTNAPHLAPPAPLPSAAVPVARRTPRQDSAAAPQIADSLRIAAPLNIAQTSNPQVAPPAPVPSAAVPVARRTGRLDTAAAPQIAETTKNVGTDLTQANAPHVAQPAPIPSNAAAVAPHRTARSESAAPEIGAQSNGNPADVRKLVAISANPAPPSSDVKIPQGNLAANISLSPDGARPGSPGGADRGTATKSAPTAGGSAAGNSESANAGAGSLPAAISVSPAGAKPASGGVGRAANLIPNLSLKPVIPAEGARAEKAGPANVAALAPGAPPEKLLSGEMFTLHASTPNMTSTRGSWVLNVAQLGADPRPVYRPKGDLSGPLPIHTVDPRYPPETMDEHIEGEVVLYAIIRKDGSVDSIQVVRSLDPRLDKAAIAALAQWRFRPGSRAGEPVDLEAVVHVRFEYRRPNY